jgi:hypothetical protein
VFQRNLDVSEEHVSVFSLSPASSGFMLGLFIQNEVESSIVLLNIGLSPNCTVFPI